MRPVSEKGAHESRKPNLVEFSLAFWPVVLMTLNGSLSADDVDEMSKGFDEAFGRKSTHVNIIDARGVHDRPDALVRKKMAELVARTGEESKRWSLGTVIVVDNALLRSAITAIHWIAPASVPVVAAATLEEAVEQCSKWLAANKVAFDSDLFSRLKLHAR